MTTQPKTAPYTYKDFVTNKIRRTSGRFAGWTNPGGPLGVQYAKFNTRCMYALVPVYLLTPETKARIGPPTPTVEWKRPEAQP